jgi:hypothetical protein
LLNNDQKGNVTGWESRRAIENMPYGIIQQQMMQAEICIAGVFIIPQIYYISG